MSETKQKESLWLKMNMNFEEEKAQEQSELATEIWRLPEPERPNPLFDPSRTYSTECADDDLRHLKPSDLSEMYVGDQEVPLPPQLPPPRKQEVRNISEDSLWEWLQGDDDVEGESDDSDCGDDEDDREKILAALGELEVSSGVPEPKRLVEQFRVEGGGSAESETKPTSEDPPVDKIKQSEANESKSQVSIIALERMESLTDMAEPSSTQKVQVSGKSTWRGMPTKQREFEPKGMAFLPSKRYALSVFDAFDDDKNQILTFRQALRLAKTVLPVHEFEHKAPIFETEETPESEDELLLWRHQLEGFLRYIIYYNCYYADYASHAEHSTSLTRMEVLQLFGAPVYFAIFGTQTQKGGPSSMTYVQLCSRLAKNTCVWDVEVPDAIIKISSLQS